MITRGSTRVVAWNCSHHDSFQHGSVLGPFPKALRFMCVAGHGAQACSRCAPSVAHRQVMDNHAQQFHGIGAGVKVGPHTGMLMWGLCAATCWSAVVASYIGGEHVPAGIMAVAVGMTLGLGIVYQRYRGARLTYQAARSRVIAGRKFKVEGGRSGVIRFEETGTPGRMAWELCLGESAMAIDPDTCTWCTPTESKISAPEVRRIVQEFSTEVGVSVEVGFQQGYETFWPTAAARLASDRGFYDLLGSERSGTVCRTPGCVRGAVPQSALCKRHHFEALRRRPCPFDD
jgi:hypothetical protein